MLLILKSCKQLHTLFLHVALLKIVITYPIIMKPICTFECVKPNFIIIWGCVVKYKNSNIMYRQTQRACVIINAMPLVCGQYMLCNELCTQITCNEWIILKVLILKY